MNKDLIKKYYAKWQGNSGTPESFVAMLEKKQLFSEQNDCSLYAYDGLKTAEELNQMWQLADSMLMNGEFEGGDIHV